MSVKREIFERVGSLPLLRPLARMAYERHFARRSGLFRGIYNGLCRCQGRRPTWFAIGP
jgi:hypothetical protein